VKIVAAAVASLFTVLCLAACGGSSPTPYALAAQQFSHSFSKDFRTGFARCSATSESTGDCIPTPVEITLIHDRSAPAAYVDEAGAIEECFHRGYVWTCYAPSNDTLVARFLVHTAANDRTGPLTHCEAGVETTGNCDDATQMAGWLRHHGARTAVLFLPGDGPSTICHRIRARWECFATAHTSVQTRVEMLLSGGVPVSWSPILGTRDDAHSHSGTRESSRFGDATAVSVGLRTSQATLTRPRSASTLTAITATV
jgi:hypothetical protein